MKMLEFIHGYLLLLGCGTAQESSGHLPVPSIVGKPEVKLVSPLDETNAPIIAVWQESPGYTADTNYPYLRFAVWSDGRVVFARKPSLWSHDLLLGKLSGQTLDKLKADIRKTGVFALKGNCYLVPDAPVDCLMLSFEGARQMLYWDEVEHASHGININPKPQHLAFKKAWWEVNRLALSALPDRADKLNAHFRPRPKGWYLKQTIQSE